MRLLVEILVVGALIYLGWERPFREWLPGAKPGATTPATATASGAASPTAAPQLRPIVRTVPTPSGAWMWEHHGALDRPTPGPTRRP